MLGALPEGAGGDAAEGIGIGLATRRGLQQGEREGPVRLLPYEGGEVFYFFAKKTGATYGWPTAAEKSGTGYLVRFPDSSFRFRDLEVTAYDKNDKELWKEKLTPEAAVG